ncbi:MAG: hypothetical protein HY216_10785 [Candidatus Rokubacteria bacterium]|nr:hypothetical protein [Candidatus Rokubacteria bacterium]
MTALTTRSRAWIVPVVAVALTAAVSAAQTKDFAVEGPKGEKRIALLAAEVAPASFYRYSSLHVYSVRTIEPFWDSLVNISRVFPAT